MATYAFAGPDRIVCTYAQAGLGRLAVLDLETRDAAPARTAVHRVRLGARRRRPRACSRAARPIIPPASSRSISRSGEHRVLKKSTDILDRAGPAHRRLPHDGRGPSNFRPPAARRRSACSIRRTIRTTRRPQARSRRSLVKCHGGPTAAASSTLNLCDQYWTSRGIAVLDVNYGGSTGFGRAYRERLNGNWGIVDVDDCVNGAKFLAAAGPGRRQARRHHRRQRRRLHHARGARVPRLLPGRREPLRRQRPRGARARHPQVRVALSRLADRALSAGGGALSRALAALPRRAAVEAGDLLPGRRGRGRAAEPDRGDGRGAAPQGQRRSAISCSPASSTASARPTTSSAPRRRARISMRSRCSRSG